MDEDDMKEIMEGDELLYGHLSNSHVQRTHVDYNPTSSSIEGQTMLNDWDAFIKFMHRVSVKERQFEMDWFEHYQFAYDDIGQITLEDMRDLVDVKCSRLLAQLYSASKGLNDADSIEYDRPCQFTFHGADIIIDERGKFYLLEVNRCPSLSLIGHESVKQMTRNMLKEAIDICLEIRQLKIKGKRVHQHTRLESPHFWKKCRLDYPLDAVDRIDSLIECVDEMLCN